MLMIYDIKLRVYHLEIRGQPCSFYMLGFNMIVIINCKLKKVYHTKSTVVHKFICLACTPE